MSHQTHHHGKSAESRRGDKSRHIPPSYVRQQHQTNMSSPGEVNDNGMNKEVDRYIDSVVNYARTRLDNQPSQTPPIPPPIAVGEFGPQTIPTPPSRPPVVPFNQANPSGRYMKDRRNTLPAHMYGQSQQVQQPLFNFKHRPSLTPQTLDAQSQKLRHVQKQKVSNGAEQLQQDEHQTKAKQRQSSRRHSLPVALGNTPNAQTTPLQKPLSATHAPAKGKSQVISEGFSEKIHQKTKTASFNQLKEQQTDNNNRFETPVKLENVRQTGSGRVSNQGGTENDQRMKALSRRISVDNPAKQNDYEKSQAMIDSGVPTQDIKILSESEYEDSTLYEDSSQSDSPRIKHVGSWTTVTSDICPTEVTASEFPQDMDTEAESDDVKPSFSEAVRAGEVDEEGVAKCLKASQKTAPPAVMPQHPQRQNSGGFTSSPVKSGLTPSEQDYYSRYNQGSFTIKQEVASPPAVAPADAASKDKDTLKAEGPKLPVVSCNSAVQTDVRTNEEEEKAKAHFAQLGQFALELYKHDKYTDVIVEVGGSTFSAHHLVLCCHSAYFSQRLLQSCMDVHSRQQHHLEVGGEVSPAAFQLILDYMYTGDIEVTHDNVAELIQAALVLYMTYIQERCRRVLLTMCPQTVLGVMQTAEKHNLEDIIAMAYQMVTERFIEVAATSSFQHLSLERLLALLSRDDLQLTSELDIAIAAIRWINYDMAERQQFITPVMRTVRFPLMSDEEMFITANLADYIFENSDVRQMLLQANWHISAMRVQQNSRLPGLPMPQPRRYLPSREAGALPHPALRAKWSSQDTTGEGELRPGCILQASLIEALFASNTERNKESKATTSAAAIDQGINEMPTKLCETSSFESKVASNSRSSDEWLQSGGVRKNEDEDSGKPASIRCSGPICGSGNETTTSPTLGSSILAFGGYNPLSSDDLEVGNLNLPQCKMTLTSMPQPRMYHAVERVGSEIFVIGGCDPSDMAGSGAELVPLRSMLIYHADTGAWTEGEPLDTGLMRHSACQLDGIVYVIGGISSDFVMLDSLRSYDCSTDTWSSLAPMGVQRIGAAAAVFRGKILVVGGYGSVSSQNEDFLFRILYSVDCFDPQTQSWTKLSPLRIPRCDASLAVANNALYIIGGMTSDLDDPYNHDLRRSLVDVDVYAQDRDAWRQESQLNVARHEAGCAVLGTKIYIVGGSNTTSNEAISSLESYDTEASTYWETLTQQLPNPTIGPQCIAMEDSPQR